MSGCFFLKHGVDILLFVAISVNYTRVIQANDQLLTPENRDIDVSTRVLPGRGTHGLKIGTNRLNRDEWQPYE